ncbi:MAG: sel1 repeat family protein, partial [Rhizobiales bacterium]|nr:sel1 repeat family protein [Hyphomicrobiales bacterium]
LAVLHAEGIDGKPDYANAALWFRKAAQHGIADSQYNLGVLSARGLGTEKNFEESYKWFALAASQGDREAGKKRDEIASQLDGEALAAAQQAVKTFAPTPQPEEATVVAEPSGGWDRAAGAPAPHGKPRLAPPMSLGAMTSNRR